MRVTAQLDAVLSALEVLPFDAPADKTYGLLRVRLGENDLLIAAQALSLGHVLVTDNEREFARVDGLRCENWRR